MAETSALTICHGAPGDPVPNLLGMMETETTKDTAPISLNFRDFKLDSIRT